MCLLIYSFVYVFIYVFIDIFMCLLIYLEIDIDICVYIYLCITISKGGQGWSRMVKVIVCDCCVCYSFAGLGWAPDVFDLVRTCVCQILRILSVMALVCGTFGISMQLIHMSSTCCRLM